MNYDLNKVKQAAKFLDKKHPGWFKKINTVNLDLESTSFCILAQLYGGASYMGVDALGIIDKPRAALGYRSFRDQADRDTLKYKWIKQINKRLEQEND